MKLNDLTNVCKSISDESRMRILLALEHGELCACELMELLGLSASTVSKHMAILAQAELILTRKDGRWHYYRLPGDEADPAVKLTLQWVREMARLVPELKKDVRQKVKEICSCRG